MQGTAVLGEQRLVRGDHALAGTQRLHQPGPGRFETADDLDDHVDVVALDQPERVGREQPGVDRQRSPVATGPADRDADQLQRRADPGGQVLGLLVQEADHLATDGAAPQQRNLDHHHPTSNAIRSASVSRRTISRACPSRTATTGGRGTWL